MDMSWVNNRLAVGAAVNADDVPGVIGAGVTHVVDCRAEFDDTAEFAQNPAISVLWDPTADDGQTKPPEWFAKGVSFALAALLVPSNKVYCHCAAGVNRGPSMCYAVLRALGWSPGSAETMVRSVRPQVGLAYKTDADIAITKLGYA